MRMCGDVRMGRVVHGGVQMRWKCEGKGWEWMGIKVRISLMTPKENRGFPARTTPAGTPADILRERGRTRRVRLEFIFQISKTITKKAYESDGRSERSERREMSINIEKR